MFMLSVDFRVTISIENILNHDLGNENRQIVCLHSFLTIVIKTDMYFSKLI